MQRVFTALDTPPVYVDALPPLAQNSPTHPKQSNCVTLGRFRRFNMQVLIPTTPITTASFCAHLTRHLSVGHSDDEL